MNQLRFAGFLFARFELVCLATMLLVCASLACQKNSANDQALTTDVQGKLSADPMTKSANVNVAVKNGVVTLSGDVPSSDVELEAVKVANGTSGVTSVNDQMKVNPNAPAAASYPPVSPQAAPAPPNSAPAPPPGAPMPAEPSTVTIPAGARVTVRMIDSIDSAHSQTGQVFRASLNAPLVSHGQVIVRAGAPVSVLLAQARGAGHLKGSSELEVRLSRLEYHGRSYSVDSSIYEEQGQGRGKQTVERTGIGAAAGAVIGAIAGHGKGAAIGAAAGGGAGAGFQLLTHGQQVKIPSESVLTFRLEAPLTLTR